MTREWRVGDKVRLTGADWSREHHGAQAGDVVVISRVIDVNLAVYQHFGNDWYIFNDDSGPGPDWSGELVEDEEVGEMTRLPRERKGKTPIDVGMVQQDGLTRVRISMGEDGGSRKNSDLSIQETEDLIAMLNYHMLVAKGEIIPDD